MDVQYNLIEQLNNTSIIIDDGNFGKLFRRHHAGDGSYGWHYRFPLLRTGETGTICLPENISLSGPSATPPATCSKRNNEGCQNSSNSQILS